MSPKSGLQASHNCEHEMHHGMPLGIEGIPKHMYSQRRK